MTTLKTVYALIDALHSSKNFGALDERQALLNGIPDRNAIITSNNPEVHLQRIIEHAISRGEIDDGEKLAIDVLQDNVHRFISEESELGQSIAQLFKKLRVSLRESSLPSTSQLPLFVRFTNRFEEIKFFTTSCAPAYFLLDAPASYGKTALLRELQQSFCDIKWVCTRVENDGTNLRGLVTALSDEFGIDPTPIIEKDVNVLGAWFAPKLKSKWETTLNSNGSKCGIALLIDLGKETSLEFLELLARFIYDVRDNLSALPLFQTNSNRFRVIIAGRFLGVQKSSLASKLPELYYYPLSPFSYDIIRNSAIDFLPKSGYQTWIAQIAAHVFYLTGGHPDCMAQILKQYRETEMAPDGFMRSYRDIISVNIVSKVADEIYNQIPDFSTSQVCGSDHGKCRDILQRLSVFRYMNGIVLKEIIKREQPLCQGWNEPDLEDALIQTQLIKLENRLLEDSITRRLLVIRLRSKQPTKFPEYCQTAREICSECLSDQFGERSEWWAIEYLFQSLQRHAGKIESTENRDQFRKDFFEQDVPQALKLFIDDRNVPQERMHREKDAFNDRLGKDWEFKFTVNYYLRKRDDQYDDEPYQELKRQVNRIFDDKM